MNRNRPNIVAYNMQKAEHNEKRDSFLVGWKYAQEQENDELELTPRQVHELFPNVHIDAFLNGFNDCLKGDKFRFNLLFPGGKVIE